tara:strand:- start:172 stop:405 length:234 start_codon:yes stop_codon:yes gene_type:complete
MKLVVTTSKFKHDKELSSYNNNYYIHEEGYIIYEKCHENYNYYSFYLFENGVTTFIGDSHNSFNDDVFELNFKMIYT